MFTKERHITNGCGAIRMVEAGEIKYEPKCLDIQALFGELSASYPQKYPHIDGSAPAGERELTMGLLLKSALFRLHHQWRGGH